LGRRVAALAFGLFLAALARADSAPRVEAVELRLPAGADGSGFPALVAVQRGQPLSPRAVRRSIERLFATGRLSDVVVTSEPVPGSSGGVRVVFELKPVQKIERLEVAGAHVQTRAEVLAAAHLSDGAEYYPDRVDEAIHGIGESYARRGYPHAQVAVDVSEQPGGVELTLRLDEGAPLRVHTVSVVGITGVPLYQLVDAFGVRDGDVLDRDALVSGLDRVRLLFREQRYYRAQVSEPTVDVNGDRADIALPLDAGPRFEFRFAHARSFPDNVLEGVLDYDGSEPLDGTVETRLARRIETFYRYRGFPDARVTPGEHVGPVGELAYVRFEVDEGEPMRVRTVDFEGNQALSTAELRDTVAELIAEKRPVPQGDVHANDDPLRLEGRRLSAIEADQPEPPPNEVFVEDAYREAADQIAQRYHELGYLSAQVRMTALDRTLAGRDAKVSFAVEEGVQTVVKTVAVRGLPDQFTVPSEAQLATGGGLNRNEVEQARASLTRALGRGGYLFAHVDATTNVSDGGRAATVSFAVDPGPQVHVGQVIVQGLRRTDPELVRKNLSLRSGDVLDPERLYESQKDLVTLAVFRTVGVHLIEPEVAEPTKDVVVEVKERPLLSGEIGGGYSLADGPRILTDVIYPNLFGRGVSLSGHAKLNYVGLSAQAVSTYQDSTDLQGINGIDGRATVSIQEQRIYGLLPLQVGAHLDLIGERVHRPSYRYSRVAAVAGADWAATRWLDLSLQYQIENDVVRAPAIEDLLGSINQIDAQRLRFPQGNFALQSLGPTLTLDFRDDPLNPHRGILFQWSNEVMHDLDATLTDADGNETGKVPIFNLKSAASLSGYIPLGRRVVLALSARGGRIFPLNPKSETIAPERFFMGGALSLRGFGEDALLPADRRTQLHQELAACSVPNSAVDCTAAQRLMAGDQLPSEGGELFELAKAELRFPAFGAFDLGVFAEAGNLWLSASNAKAFELRYVAGLGLRYVTPVGPLALDFGFNLSPDTAVNEPTVGIHFSVGLF
jgi:outer membrane protein insertion porin family